MSCNISIIASADTCTARRTAMCSDIRRNSSTRVMTPSLAASPSRGLGQTPLWHAPDVRSSHGAALPHAYTRLPEPLILPPTQCHHNSAHQQTRPVSNPFAIINTSFLTASPAQPYTTIVSKIQAPCTELPEINTFIVRDRLFSRLHCCHCCPRLFFSHYTLLRRRLHAPAGSGRRKWRHPSPHRAVHMDLPNQFHSTFCVVCNQYFFLNNVDIVHSAFYVVCNQHVSSNANVVFFEFAHRARGSCACALHRPPAGGTHCRQHAELCRLLRHAPHRALLAGHQVVARGRRGTAARITVRVTIDRRQTLIGCHVAWASITSTCTQQRSAGPPNALRRNAISTPVAKHACLRMCEIARDVLPVYPPRFKGGDHGCRRCHP